MDPTSAGAEAMGLDVVRARCRAVLAGYKIPRAMCVVERIECRPSGTPDPRRAATITETGPWIEGAR
jgi:3-oxocholest-4-en-26-oate---CoA ligase